MERKSIPSRQVEIGKPEKRRGSGGGWLLWQKVKAESIRIFKKCPEHQLGSCQCGKPRGLISSPVLTSR